MSAKAKTCVVIVCDGCNDEHNHDYTPHWDSLDEGREETVDGYEWWTDGADIDLCQHCKTLPHSFVPDRDDEHVCGRCGVEREEHQEAPAGDGQ